MSLPARAFSAQVQLPCRVFCGPESILDLSGTAVSIDTHSLVLAMPTHASAPENQLEHPQPGDKVRLEISLPVSERHEHAKYLALRALVAHVAELNDGSRHVTFTFRKASFKDRPEGGVRKPAKQTAKSWWM